MLLTAASYLFYHRATLAVDTIPIPAIHVQDLSIRDSRLRFLKLEITSMSILEFELSCLITLLQTEKDYS